MCTVSLKRVLEHWECQHKLVLTQMYIKLLDYWKLTVCGLRTQAFSGYCFFSPAGLVQLRIIDTGPRELPVQCTCFQVLTRFIEPGSQIKPGSEHGGQVSVDSIDLGLKLPVKGCTSSRASFLVFQLHP